jgi:23S rRNA (uracil1939-C5)-methyltransferase
LADELAPYDTAVVDPPRSGARAQTAELARAELSRVVMVSCNPATFARDARLLSDAGFHCHWIQPIDQFLWSPHLELVAAFTRP